MDALERETAAFMGIAGAVRAAGGDIDIPTFAETREHFDDWLLDESDATEDHTMKRALGIGGG